MKNLFLSSITSMQILLNSFSYKLRSRTAPQHFSREGGKLGFKNIVQNLMNFNNKSQQVELDNYIEFIGEHTSVSKQAFSERRQYIKPEAFKELFDTTLKDIPNNSEIAKLNGYTVVGIDGSTIALDNLPELIKHFGCSGPKALSCTGRISIACDTLNGVILDASICKYGTGERKLAEKHVENVIKLGIEKPLFIIDRGYAGKKLLAQIDDAGTKYILRVRSRWMTELVKETKSGKWGEFVYNGKSYRVRVIKRENVVLFSNIGSEFTEEMFSYVYSLRWPVETKYNVIKNKLQLENFTGKTVTAVLQDFWVIMTLANLSAFTKLEADRIIEIQDADKDLKHIYQANNNVLIGKLKNKLIIMLLCDDPIRQSKIFDDIVGRLVKSKVPRKWDEHNPRKPTRQKKKFNQSTKSAL